MKKETNYKRSGDHYLHEIDKLPDGLEIIEHNERFVFGVGEASNHNHTIVANKAEDFDVLKDKSGRYYFVIKSTDVQISHLEGDSSKTADHRTIPSKVKIYKQVHEREVDIFSQAIRKVID